MVGASLREHICSLWGHPDQSESMSPTRMVRDQRYKLIYYSVGNILQLFDMQEDPHELKNRAGDPELAEVQDVLTRRLVDFLASDEADAAWIRNGELIGSPEEPYEPSPDRGLSGQRGLHWPPPPSRTRAGTREE